MNGDIKENVTRRSIWLRLGFMILMSTLAWVFAVGLPTMNRELRSQARTVRWAYLSGLVEMFGRVVLCAVVFIFTAALVTVVT